MNANNDIEVKDPRVNPPSRESTAPLRSLENTDSSGVERTSSARQREDSPSRNGKAAAHDSASEAVALNSAPQAQEAETVESMTSASRATVDQSVFLEERPRPLAGIPIRAATKLKCAVPANDEARSTWDTYPGVLLTAAGLAMQGLGRAHIWTNFPPPPQPKAPMRWIFGAGKKHRTSTTAWGVDLGSNALKAVKMSVDPKEESAPMRIEAAGYYEYRTALGHTLSWDEERSVIQEAVEKLRLEHKVGRGDVVILGVPTKHFYLRTIELPVPRKKAHEAILFEAKRVFPLMLDELYWDYHLYYISANADAAAEEPEKFYGEDVLPHQVVLAGLRRTTLDPLLQTLKEVKLNVTGVQCSALAAYNVFHREGALPGTSGRPAASGRVSDRLVGLLDVGGSSMTLLLVGEDTLWSHSTGVGGDLITRHLVQRFKMTYSKAEQLKRAPQRLKNPKSTAKAIKALGEVYEDIEVTVADALKKGVQRVRKPRFAGLFTIGGAMMSPGLLHKLQKG